jgi:hypothetical protein
MMPLAASEPALGARTHCQLLALVPALGLALGLAAQLGLLTLPPLVALARHCCATAAAAQRQHWLLTLS